MDPRIDRIAFLANQAAYDAKATQGYIDGAPHLKHASLRARYGRLVVEVFDRAQERSHPPKVLDLGAGEGGATLPFLELGAAVTAVDSSKSQLEALRERCAAFADKLEVRCEDVHDVLGSPGKSYDVIVANSFLHHIPDYLGFLGKAAAALPPGGQFFSFQDPLRYDSLGAGTRAFCGLSYLSWRLFKGDVLGGLSRRLRRSRGVYLEESVQDNAEYHVLRNGLDQDAIARQFSDLGFDCRLLPYFSTQSRLFQPLGEALGVRNTFAVVARRRA